mmetsp:Transcript_66326/g.154079  ORF Transcript_66326/g.154079 Transcript_66326/m.154079 type:complete len:227 (-) Transcript_66326:25-705(-)|eukprot:CAMPEP_0171091932 /NCGR_PEP_ID=MMETSP0766_2-20121228/35404_1 /TAXON_ID=439317 /ORGANISM="Gambierdiscus australes, Strain CAWD 149" /LENGTH=226 /DNA_ID=CAMNT_0011550117 /DNA_START=218 /DNA_END=898 /DNA_ORIENTATION=+
MHAAAALTLDFYSPIQGFLSDLLRPLQLQRHMVRLVVTDGLRTQRFNRSRWELWASAVQIINHGRLHLLFPVGLSAHCSRCKQSSSRRNTQQQPPAAKLIGRHNASKQHRPCTSPTQHGGKAGEARQESHASNRQAKDHHLVPHCARRLVLGPLCTSMRFHAEETRMERLVPPASSAANLAQATRTCQESDTDHASNTHLLQHVRASPESDHRAHAGMTNEELGSP